MEKEIAAAFAEFISGRPRRFTITYESGTDDRDTIRRALGVRAPKYIGPPRYVIKGRGLTLILTEEEDGSYTPEVV